jgi:hypothetical protein
MAKSAMRGVLLDLGVLSGLGLVALGLFQLSVPAGWIFVGVVLVVVNLILAERSVNPPPSRPKESR